MNDPYSLIVSKAAEPDDGPALLQVAPARWMGEDFGAYLDAAKAAGFRYDATLKSFVGAYHRLPDLHREVGRRNMQVVVDDSAAAVVRESVGRLRRDAEEAARQMTEVASPGLQLRPYQVEGAVWLRSRNKALLGDDMGIGKTAQILAAHPKGSPFLAICPASVKGVWARECAKWRPDLRVRIANGRKDHAPPAADEALIINFDVLPKAPDGKDDLRPSLLDLLPGTTVAVDEAQHVKGNTAKSRNTRALTAAALKGKGRAWLSTGTPLINRPMELWKVLQAADLHLDAFGSWTGFVSSFSGAKINGVWEFGDAKSTAATSLARVMLRRTKAQVLKDLPPITYDDREVEVTGTRLKDVQAAYDEAVEAGWDPDDPLTVRSNAVASISRMRRALAAAKIEAAVEIVEELEEAGEPVVVFCCHREPVDVLSARPGWGHIHGDDSPAAKTAAEDAFQRGEYKGIAISTRAGSTGITLTRAAFVVQVDLDWTPAVNAQAVDRVRRISQTRPVSVITLVANHKVDRRVSEVLSVKSELIAATVKATPSADEGHRALLDLVDALHRSGAPVPFAKSTRVLKALRPAATDAERMHAHRIMAVSDMDQDRAQQRNGVGFSKFDSDFGNSLAEKLRTDGLLSDRQWAAVVALGTKYRKQV